MADLESLSPDLLAGESARLTLFDLPQEIRDMIYLYFRPYRWITITEMPDALQQPNMSKVCKQIRKESLDVFYGRNRFMIDIRGHKHPNYPSSWSPLRIFNNWISAIGDVNAARLRNLSFYLANFTVHLAISPEATAKLSARFSYRGNYDESIDIAEDAPSGYTNDHAIERAQRRLTYLVNMMNDKAERCSLTVGDYISLCADIEEIQPTLCIREELGWKGAIMPEDPSLPPAVRLHLSHCNACRLCRRAGL